VLSDARPATRLPAQDLERARKFYAQTLGLDPADERPGGLLYRSGDREFALYRSAGQSPGTFTQMVFEVDDVDAVVAGLRQRGVVFEEVDGPRFATVNGIAEVRGNYPSKHSSGERAAWFRDSEGNLLGVSELIR
jgi:catechol 2,3-dioxygenase-like lactoylglutathione lyase family enzyme